MPGGISRALRTYMRAIGLSLLYLDNFNVRLNEKDQSPVLLSSSLEQALHSKPQTALGRVNWRC